LVAAFDDLERDHISDNAHEVVEGTEDLVDHIMAGRSVMHCMVCHVAHRCHNNRGADLVEGTVVGSSMHLMRVHNRCSMVHNGGRMDHGGSMMDHRGNMVDHWSSVDESGHNRLLFLFRCPQVNNFSRVSNFCFNLFSSFLNYFFNSFFHNRLDNSLFHCLLFRSNRSRGCSFDLVRVDADRKLSTEDGRVMVGGVHSVVNHRGSMVD